MENLIEKLRHQTSSPIAKCLFTIVAMFFSCLGLIALLSDTGFSAEITQYRLSVYVGATSLSLILGSLVYARSSGRRLREQIAALQEQLTNCASALAAATEYREELAQARSFLYRMLETRMESDAFEISKAVYQSDTVYIELKKRRGKRLGIGHRLVVLHKEDGKSMGHFRVIEERSKTYYAQGVDVDEIWTGFMKQQGEVTMTPYLAAIHIKEVAGDE